MSGAWTDDDRSRIADAIKAAEQGHRGEIMVHVELRALRDPLKRAEQMYRKLGADKTRDGTGVLLYVATASKRAAVWAGPGIAGGDDSATWKPVFDAFAAGSDGEIIAKLCSAIGALGKILETRAAGTDTAGNELGDGVSS